MPKRVIIEKVGILLKIEQHFRKSINQNISSNTLDAHFNKAIILFAEIDELLLKNQDEIPDKEFFTFTRQSRNAIEYIKESVRVRKVTKINNLKQVEMATENPFDAKLAASVLMPFDGDAEKLSAFIDGVKFLKKVYTQAQHGTLKLFLLTRISGKARDALPNNIQETTIDAMIDLIKSACESKTTAEQILAKIKSVKRGLSKQQYCQEVEILCNKLTNIYVRENVPHATAKKLATKAGLETLINSTSNETEKIILQAGTFSTIEEAIQKVNELPDSVESSNSMNRVFHVNSKRIMQKRQTQNRGNYNVAPRGSHQSNQRYGSYPIRFNNNQSRPFPNNNNYRYRTDNRGHARGYPRQFNRIYFADNQSSSPMQNVFPNPPPGVQSQGQHFANANTVQPPNMTQPNQPFFGTVGQYTQSM